MREDKLFYLSTEQVEQIRDLAREFRKNPTCNKEILGRNLGYISYQNPGLTIRQVVWWKTQCEFCSITTPEFLTEVILDELLNNKINEGN